MFPVSVSGGMRAAALLLAATLVPACGGSGPGPVPPPSAPSPAVGEGRREPILVQTPLLEASTADLKRTVVVPHAGVPMPPGKNVLWCATFQLAWDALRDEVVHGPLDLGPPAPPGLVAEMNRRSFPREALDPACFLARAGFVSDGIEESVRSELRERFGFEMPPTPTLPPSGALAVGFLRKSLPFAHRFERRDPIRSFHGGRKEVPSFGIGAFSPRRDAEHIRRQVIVHADGPDADFVLEFAVKGRGDRVLLASVPPGTTLEATWDSVRDRLGEESPPLEPGDSLLIPKVNFRLDHRFRELEGAFLRTGPGELGPLVEARQVVRLGLDEGGVLLESLADIGLEGEPREYRADRPFLIALLQRGAEEPYLLLWIENDELLAGVE